MQVASEQQLIQVVAPKSFMARRGLEQVKAVQVQAESAVRAKRYLEALLADPQLMLHPTDAFAIAAIAMGTLALPIGNLKSEAWGPAMTHGLNSLCQVAPDLAVESGFATLIRGPTSRFLRSRPKRLLRWAHGVQYGAPDGSRWQVPAARLPAVRAAFARALPTPQSIEAALASAIEYARSDVTHRSKGLEALGRVSRAEARERLLAGFYRPGAATKCMRRSANGRFYLRERAVRSVAKLSSKELRVSATHLEEEHVKALQAAMQAQDATEAIDSRETVRKVRESLQAFEEAICEILRPKRKDDKVTLAARDWLLDLVRASTGHGEPPLAIAEFAASRGVDRSHLNKRITAARQALGKHPALRHLAPD